MSRLPSGVAARVQLMPGAELTLEANPGALEHERFEAYRAAGINRISLGVQSFDDAKLKRLGRIHGANEAEEAILALKKAGFERFNIDLMWALPEQTIGQVVADVEKVLSFDTHRL